MTESCQLPSEQKMKRHLLKSGFAVVFGAALLGMIGVLEGTINLGGESVWAISEVAVSVGFLSLIAGALLGGRDPSDYESWEIATVAVALALHAVVFLEEPVAAVELLEDNHPWTGLLAAAVSYVGYWALAFRGD